MGDKNKGLKGCYEDGKCPDCGQVIPDTAVENDACSNCGHVFWLDTACDDGCPGQKIAVGM
jgi:hypothetical protein